MAAKQIGFKLWNYLVQYDDGLLHTDHLMRYLLLKKEVDELYFKNSLDFWIYIYKIVRSWYYSSISARASRSIYCESTLRLVAVERIIASKQFIKEHLLSTYLNETDRMYCLSVREAMWDMKRSFCNERPPWYDYETDMNERLFHLFLLNSL